MSLLKPIRSEVCHAKTSLLLSSNESSSFSSLDDRSCEIITALSGTLGSNGTLLVSHSGSIVGLLAKLTPLLVAVASLQPYAFSSCKQFTFLCPCVKPCSMFLASF
jgi:hypothetical protein